MLDSVRDLPAMVIGRRSEVLAWNPLAAALITDFGALPPEHRNMVRLAFLEPAFRALYGDWERVAQDCVASLRMEAGRDPDDQRTAALVGELSMKDEDFRRWWADHRVRGSEQRRKTYVHPVAGPMTLDVVRMALAGGTDQTLVVYTAEPGSPTRRRCASSPGGRATRRTGSRRRGRFGCSAAALAGSILRRRFAMCVRSAACRRAYAGPQTSVSSARWVISRPRLRSERAQQVELDRGQVDLARRRGAPCARRGRSRARRPRSRARPGLARARRSAACRRATSSRGPNGLVT